MPISELLTELNRHLTEPRVVGQRLITTGRRYSGWLSHRIQSDQQILINAIICHSPEMQEQLRLVRYQTEREFSGRLEIKSLPYPYENIELMKTVIESLIRFFNSSIYIEDVIQDFSGSSRSRSELTGYILLTIVRIPVII